MKILIDARLYGLEHAGLGRYTMNLVSNLVKLDRNNEYLLLLRKDYFNEIQLPKNWKIIKADFRHYSFIEQIILPLIIYKERPDVVHFPHFNTPLLYFGKYIVTIHDLLMHKFVGEAVTTLPLPFYWIRRIGYSLAFMKAIKGSKEVIVPTEYVKKDVIDNYNIPTSKIQVIYEGATGMKTIKGKEEIVNTLRKFKIKSPYFVYVGNLYPHKNIDGAVEAMVALNKELDKQIELLIICSRSVFSKKLKETIKNKNADRLIRYLGFVKDNEMSILLNNSLAFIYPSFEEGFGLQGLEAMIAGTLVLASDIPVFKEIYKSHAVYFDPNSKESMVKAMKIVMKITGKKREQLIERSQNFAGNYSWKNMAKQTLSIYRSV
jgi:glycosyltransferase involved in cell wall biosynthesis